MIRLSLCISSILIFTFVIAQKPKTVKGKVSNVKTTISKALEKKLDSIFSSYNKNTPGIAVTVLEKGKVIAKKTYGMASLEFSIPFSHHTLVRLPYSEGREFISIATALMEKDGLLNINDRVRKYFPKLPDWSETVTVQDLLNHSSGFADEWATLALTQASMANRLDKSQFLQFLYNQPTPSVEPGIGYMYSNSDFGLLRLILEKASGEDLSAYMKRRVFSPLGMKDSRIHNDKEEVILNSAFTYNIGVNNTYKLWLQDKTSPGGNYFVLTSANDLEKWAEAHTDQTSFIYAAVQRLQQDARPIPVLPGTNYVFGHKHRLVGTNRALVHMGVSELPYISHVPEANLTVILLSNLFVPRWYLMKQVLSTVLKINMPVVQKKELTKKQITVDPEKIKSYAGTYKWLVPLTYQSYVPRKRYTKFISSNGVLKVLYSDQDTLDLLPIEKNTFRDPEFPELFVFSEPKPDSGMRLILYTYDGDSIQMEKLSYDKPKLTRSELQRLTGKYYSSHLDYYLTIVSNENDQLIIKRPTIADKILEPWFDGDYRLMTDYGPYSSESWVHFFFNDNGEVSHFTVSHPRLMNHRFEKVDSNNIKK